MNSATHLLKHGLKHSVAFRVGMRIKFWTFCQERTGKIHVKQAVLASLPEVHQSVHMYLVTGASLHTCHFPLGVLPGAGSQDPGEAGCLLLACAVHHSFIVVVGRHELSAPFCSSCIAIRTQKPEATVPVRVSRRPFEFSVCARRLLQA